MTKSMTKLARATRAFTATLAIVGVPAVLASVPTARAYDPQATSAAWDDELNHKAAAQGYGVAPRPGPYASARQDRHIKTPPATRKDHQDIE